MKSDILTRLYASNGPTKHRFELWHTAHADRSVTCRQCRRQKLAFCLFWTLRFTTTAVTSFAFHNGLLNCKTVLPISKLNVSDAVNKNEALEAEVQTDAAADVTYWPRSHTRNRTPHLAARVAGHRTIGVNAVYCVSHLRLGLNKARSCCCSV